VAKAAIVALMILFVVAWIVAFWVHTDAVKAVRRSGYRYWFFDPFAIYRAMNWKLYLWSMFAGLLALAAAIAIAFVAGEPS